MADPTIPSLSWAIRQTLDSEEWQFSVYNEEFLQRLQLLMGHPDYFTDSSFGVVSPTNPSSHTAGSAEPLVVSRTSGPQTLTVDINPGLAVTKSGVWILLLNHVRQIPLADTTLGEPNVVYLDYTLQPADERLNDDLVPTVPLYARTGTSPKVDQITGAKSPESNQVRVDTVETYVGYVESVKQNYVPLAIVTVQTSVDATNTTVTNLAIDHTQDTYDFNRPWFSAVDIEHRSMQGSGTQSLSNPHAVGDNEVSVGNWTRSRMSLNHGMVLAKDLSVEKIPGYRCETAIPTDQLLTDDSNGTTTGFPNKKYFPLPDYPVVIGKTWITDPEEEIGSLKVPERNIIVFPGEDPPAGKTLNVYYTKVEALQPPTGSNKVNFETNNPTDDELVVAGGFNHTLLDNVQELFSDAREFPMWYELFVDGEGALRRTPQVVYCSKTLNSIGTQDTPTISQYGTGRLCVGLAEASGAGSMVVKIRIYGKDENGTSINELFTFAGGSWSGFSIPASAFPESAFLISENLFAPNIESIVIEERTDDGPNSSIMVWAINTPYDTYDSLKDACHVSSVYWDGLRLANVYDKRIIGTTNRDWMNLDSGFNSFHYTVNLLAGYHDTIYVEDFRRPEFHILQSVGEFYTKSSILAHLPSYNFSKLQVARNGPYRTKALPVTGASSGMIWNVSLLPQPAQTGSNYWVPQEPRMRYKTVAHGWSSWLSMSPVGGISNTYELDVSASQPSPVEVPIAVQVELDPWPYVGMAIFG
jgi:hypothetical protein